MVRRYEEPIEVRALADQAASEAAPMPDAFLWRGRLYVVPIAGSATLTEDDLNCGVAISFRGFDLRDTVVRHVEHGDRDRIAVIREDTHHANLATEKAQAHFFSIPTYDWAGVVELLKKYGQKKTDPYRSRLV